MAKRSTQKPQDQDWHVPLGETLDWIKKGEELQRHWSRRSGPAAEQMADSLRKRLEKMREEAAELWKLHQEEVVRKKSKDK